MHLVRAPHGRGSRLREREVADLALLDQLLHRADRVFDRHLGVHAVKAVDVNHVEAQAPERCFAGLRNIAGVARGKAFGRLETGEPQVAELGRKQHAVALALDRAPDELLVGSRSVGVRGHDQVDAEIDRAVYGRDRLGLVRLSVDARHAHAAQAYRRDLGADLSQLAHFHAYPLWLTRPASPALAGNRGRASLPRWKDR